MRHRKRLFYTYILSLLWVFLSAILGGCQRQNLSSHPRLEMYYVVLPADSFRVQSIEQAALPWKAVPAKGLSLGVLPHKEVWLKVRIVLPEKEGRQRVIAVGNAFLDEVVFFKKDMAGRRWQPCWDSTAGQQHISIFPRCAIEDTTAAFLLKIRSETPLVLPVYCLSLQELHQKEAAYFLFYGLATGFTALLFVLSCLAWGYFKERVYFNFALFLLGAGITLSINAGVPQWWFHLPVVSAKLALSSALGVWVIGAVGLVRTLVPRKHMPAWGAISLKFYLGFGLGCLWGSWLFSYALISVLTGSLAVLMNVVITYLVWLSWRRGERALFFLMIGWGIYSLCMGVYVVAALTGNSLFFARYHWAEVSVLLQSLFFVLALFHRYALWQTAQMRERLAIEEEKAELYQNIREHLQKDLQEKLQNLQQQKEEIETQNEELLQQSIQLAEQHKQIEQQLNEIKKLNAELEQRVQARTAELKASNERLLQYARQVEDYAFALAHNLRAPLARMMGLAQLMELERKQADAVAVQVSLQSLVQAMVKSAHEADEVLHDLNEIVAIRSEGLVEVGLVPVQEVIAEVLQGLKTRYLFPFSLEEEYQVSVVHANRTYLTDILESVLDNCFRFRNPARALVIRVRVFVSGDFHVIEVEDNGLGLDVDAFHSKILHPYQTFHSNSGKGMGLYMAQVKAEAMGGSISVSGERDKGLCVRISLSVKK